jgi:hypothetical protein
MRPVNVVPDPIIYDLGIECIGTSADTNGEQARRILNGWVSAFMAQYNLEGWAHRLRETTKLLSVLFFLPTVIHVHGLVTPMVPYYRIHVVSRAGKEGEAEPFEVALNGACQRVLGYRSDFSEGALQ